MSFSYKFFISAENKWHDFFMEILEDFILFFWEENLFFWKVQNVRVE